VIQTIVAYTKEIDDIETAVQEILAQLPMQGGLRQNTVGILACHYEFVYSGVVAALQKALPFDTLGAISPSQATPDVAETLMLTLMVLTSDDVSFRTSCSDSLLGAPAEAVAAAYAKAALPGQKPALILPFAAFLPQNSGDEYVAVLSKASGGAPVFGTLAVDDTSTFEHSLTVYRGEHHRDKMALLLMYGDVKPIFYIATISKDKIFDRAALITKSNGHILEEVNGRPLAEFFESFGLAQASETSYALSSIPFMLDYGDDTPLVAKVFIAMNEEHHGIFAGHMPEGSTMYMGVFDHDDVLATSGEAMRTAVQALQNASGALVYSCVSRFMTLGTNDLAELTLAKDILGPKLPFMMAYSGGEICPTLVRGETATNRFHNDSFVLCIF